MYREPKNDIFTQAVVEWTGDALTTNDVICIVRDTVKDQPYSYPNNQKHIERALDNLARQIQELQLTADNALKVDPSWNYTMDDENKMDPITWLQTIVRSKDQTLREVRVDNDYIMYSTDDPDAEAKTWNVLAGVKTGNAGVVSHIRETKVLAEDGVTYIFGFPVSRKKRKEGERPMIGMLNGDQIVLVLDSMMQRSGYIQFDTLPIPFRCVAVDISGPDEVVLKEGELAKAMRASMAIPGAFKAVEWGDKTLVDGGMINNLPVDVVRAMGADIVIAIDLSNEQHESRDFSLKDLVGIGGILDWAVSRPDWKKHNENRADADVLITPNLEGYDVMSFSLESISDMIARGERAARQVKPQLLKLKQ